MRDWGIQDEAFAKDNFERLTSDFDFASQYMLPGETREVERLKNVYVYTTNQLYDETQSTLNDDARELSQRFRDTAARIAPVAEELPAFWLKILNK